MCTEGLKKGKKPKRRKVKSRVLRGQGTAPDAPTFTVALVGRPNVGKSTLFNRLRADRGGSAQGQGRAVTHGTPGTTRDWRDAVAVLADMRFRLVDTGGVEHLTRHAGRHRGGDGDITQRMRDLTANALVQADAVLFMVSARDGVTPEDEAAARWLRSIAQEVDAAAEHGTPPLLQRTTVVANKAEGLLHWAGVEAGATATEETASAALTHDYMLGSGPLNAAGQAPAPLAFAHAVASGEQDWVNLSSDAFRLGLGPALPLSAAHGDGLSSLYDALQPAAQEGERMRTRLHAAAAHVRNLGATPLPGPLAGAVDGSVDPRGRLAPVKAVTPRKRSPEEEGPKPPPKAARSVMELGPVKRSTAGAGAETHQTQGRSKRRSVRRPLNAEQAAMMAVGVGPVPASERIELGDSPPRGPTSHPPQGPEADLRASKRRQAKEDAAAQARASTAQTGMGDSDASIVPEGAGGLSAWLQDFSAGKAAAPKPTETHQETTPDTPPTEVAADTTEHQQLHYTFGSDSGVDDAAWSDDSWRADVGSAPGGVVEGTVLTSTPDEAFRAAPTPHAEFGAGVTVPGFNFRSSDSTLPDGSVGLPVELGAGLGRVDVSPQGAVYDEKGYLVLGPSAPSASGVKAAQRSAHKAAAPTVVCVLGRPNVGKSTLTNALLGETRVLTGPAAGVTRDPTFVPMTYKGSPLTLVDTAGMRRWGQVDTASPLEPQSASAAKHALALSHVAVLVVDGHLGVSHQDLVLARSVVEEGRPLVVALNKADLLADRAATRAGAAARIEGSLPGIKGVEVVPISALSGAGLGGLLPAVIRAYERWRSRVPTGYLNRWLRRLSRHHPPPAAYKTVHIRGGGSGVMGPRRGSSVSVPLKVKFLSQTATRPPTFALFANREDVPDSYTAFLTNSLRTEFGLWGTPIRIMPRAASNPYARGHNDSRRLAEKRSAATLARLAAARTEVNAKRRRARRAATARRQGKK